MAIVRKRTWTTRAGKEKTRWPVDYRDQGAGKRRFQTYGRKKEPRRRSSTFRERSSRAFTPRPGRRITIAEAAKLWLDG